MKAPKQLRRVLGLMCRAAVCSAARMLPLALPGDWIPRAPSQDW